MATRYQVTGAYGPAEEDLYRCCPRCCLPIDRDPARATPHTAEDCERTRRTTALWAAQSDRDEGRAPSLTTVLLAYLDPGLLPWVRI